LDSPPARRDFSDTITWRHRLRGSVEPDEKEKADKLSIGGLRNTAESVGKLHTVQAFGLKLGSALREALLANYAEHSQKSDVKGSWIDLTCNLVGTTLDDARPPLAAIAVVKAILMAHTGSDAVMAMDANLA
jgi:hypothetical protein